MNKSDTYNNDSFVFNLKQKGLDYQFLLILLFIDLAWDRSSIQWHLYDAYPIPTLFLYKLPVWTHKRAFCSHFCSIWLSFLGFIWLELVEDNWPRESYLIKSDGLSQSDSLFWSF